LSVDSREDNASERYADYRRDPARIGLYPVANRDRRLPAKTLVVGVAPPSGDGVAYPLGLLARRSLVTDRRNGTPLVVLLDNRSGATAVWKVPPGANTLTRNGNVLTGPGGRAWQTVTGRALGGGPDLVPIAHTRAYWFAWSTFHPRTRLVVAVAAP